MTMQSKCYRLGCSIYSWALQIPRKNSTLQKMGRLMIQRLSLSGRGKMVQ